MVSRRLASLLVMVGVVTAACGQAPFEPAQGAVDAPTFRKTSSQEQLARTEWDDATPQRRSAEGAEIAEAVMTLLMSSRLPATNSDG